MSLSSYDRVLGSLYGMATGDALGVPSSFQTFDQVREKWGWIDRFLPPEDDHIYHAGLKAGEYTDDTEQALALLQSFVRCGRVEPRDVADEILLWAKRVEGKYASPLGPSTERALKAIQNGTPIGESGRYGNTNGSAMRIAPLGILHGLRGSAMEELVRDVHQCCLPTHNTTVCISAAAAVAWGVALCVRGESDLNAVVNGCAAAAKQGEQLGYPIASPSIARRILAVCEIVRRGGNPPDVMRELYELYGGGDLAADSVPLAVGLFLLGRGRPKEVNECCVNMGCDADTNAAMAGAMAGAFAGVEAVPPAWRDEVDRMNPADFVLCARQLVELAGRWQVAAP